MTNSGEELAFDLSPLLKVYKTGRVERLYEIVAVPASVDAATGVASVDITVNPETGLSVRLYAPTTTQPDPKSRPLLVYFHGGGFVIESTDSKLYHDYLTAVSARAGAVVVSVNYRLAPEHLLPAAYDDAVDALRWIASRAESDTWLVPRGADRSRVFLAGDSAGANIAHRAAIRVGTGEEGVAGLGLRGMALVHPYFYGVEAIGDEAAPEKAGTKAMVEGMWRCACAQTRGFDDPWFNPEKDAELARVACGRVVVFVAEKDALRHRGVRYGEVLGRSAWGGRVEVVEDEGVDHVFHLFDPTSEKADLMMGRICSFINENDDVV